jgi:hypothetical protein
MDTSAFTVGERVFVHYNPRDPSAGDYGVIIELEYSSVIVQTDDGLISSAGPEQIEKVNQD